MKLLFPALLGLLLVACETVVPEPTPGTVEHQRRLHQEARAHFLALKAQERARRGSSAQPRIAERQERAQPPVSVRSKPAKPMKVSRTSRRARTDETYYEPTPEGLAEQRAWTLRKEREYQAFERREARRLGKTPAQLTRAERAWIRDQAR